MSTLDGFQQLFGEVFEAFLFEGVLHKASLVDNGKGGYTTSNVDYPIYALIEQQTEEMRGEPNYSPTDSALLILQHHLKAKGPNGADVELDGDDEVTTTVEGRTQRWKLKAPIKQDPVNAAYIARATELVG